MLEINGNYGEGGGAIVRVALAISTLTQKPFKVYDIRKGRSQPGLKNQHLYGIKTLKELCSAKTEGDELGSEELLYLPAKLKSKNIEADIGTAGSITLLFQSILMPALFGNKKIKISIKGGTDTKWSPSFDYFNYVFLPHLRKFADIDLRLIKRGYYPKGGGEAELNVKPKFNINDFESFEIFLEEMKNNVKKINLTEQGKILAIKGTSHASSTLQNAEVAERQAVTAKSFLSKKFSCPIQIRTEYSDSLSTGSGITLWATFTERDETDYFNPIILGADTLGERGKKAEIVGREAAAQLIKEASSGAAIDKHAADMILPYIAITAGEIKTSEITNHAKTNIYTIEKFLGKIFDVNEIKNIITTKN